MSKISKVANYRIGAHASGQVSELQAALEQCKSRYPETGFPIFQFRGGEDCLVARHSTVGGDRTFIHLVCYEQGVGAAVIETLAGATINETPPPQSREFIRLQMFLFCSENHVVFAAHNSIARDRTVEHAINKMIERFGGYEQPPGFALEARLNENKFKELMDGGIEEIDLKAGGFRDTMDYLKSQGKIEGKGTIAFLQSISPKLDDDNSEAANEIVLRMKIKPRARQWGKPSVKALLGSIAKNVWDQDDDDFHGEGFAIVTKSGLTITQDEMRIRDSIAVDGNRRVLDVDQVSKQLNITFGQFWTCRGLIPLL